MKKYDYLPLELRKLGLNKNEADVYLILLESGHVSIGKIGEKAELSRPTVYRVLESLEKKELINKIQKGKKSQYIAGSPDNFLKILKVQKRKVEEQEREFLRIISVLQGKYHLLANKNEIKIYSGKQSHNILLEDLASSNTKKIRVLLSEASTVPIEELSEIYGKIKTRMGSLEVNEIHAENSKQKTFDFVVRKIAKNKNPLNIVIADKVYLFEKENGYVIEQETAIKSYLDLFNLLWDNLE